MRTFELIVNGLAVFYRSAGLEENTLAAKFGDEWKSYGVRSKFLIPFIY